MSDEMLLAYSIGRLEGMLEVVVRGEPSGKDFRVEARRMVDIWHSKHPNIPQVLLGEQE